MATIKNSSYDNSQQKSYLHFFSRNEFLAYTSTYVRKYEFFRKNDYHVKYSMIEIPYKKVIIIFSNEDSPEALFEYISKNMI